MRLRKENVERVAESEEQIRKLKLQGFREISYTEELPDDSPKPLSEMGMAELKAFAKKSGIAGAGSLTKEELLAVLKDVR